MKNIYVLLYFLLLTSCICNNKTDSTIFTDNLKKQWEKATTDTIKNIYERNIKNKTDTFELKLLSEYYGKIYHQLARRYIIKTFQSDTTFLNAKINDYVLIERTHESRMYFDVIFNKGNRIMHLSFNNIPHEKAFVLNNKDIIDDKKFQQFIHAVRVSDLFKNENNTGEYYPGEVMVSVFSKDKVEVFPYLTFNFSNEIYRRYNDMFKEE